MPELIIRKGRTDETAPLRALFERVFAETFSSPVPDFAEATAGEQRYVALLDGRLVGMATVWEPDCFVHYLLVSPTARHRRVGTALIQHLAAQYHAPLTLKCLLSNAKALGFYRATGWQEIGQGESEDGRYALLRYDGHPSVTALVMG